MTASTFSQTTNAPTENLLAKLTGEWTGTGRVMGKPVTYVATGAFIFGGKFLDLTLRDVSENARYLARLSIGWNAKNQKYVVHWQDIYGADPSKTLGIGKQEAGKLVVLYNYPEGRFRNTFTFLPDGAGWHLFIEAEDKGKWEEFAVYDFKKKV